MTTPTRQQGDPLGERLSKVAKERGMLRMVCDQCALERALAQGVPGVTMGCFLDLYATLAPRFPMLRFSRDVVGMHVGDYP